MTKPSPEQSKALQVAYDHIQASCFPDNMPQCMLTFSRNTQIIGGYYAPDKWEDDEGNKIAEIAINANIMQEAEINDVFEILAHEMVHHWQECLGTPTRKGYHNTEWAGKCIEVGLKPTSHDQPGKMTGQAISTKLIDGSPLWQALRTMPDEATLPWFASPMPVPEPGGSGGSGGGGSHPIPPSKPGTRTKYTCAKCGLNAWAKPNASLLCGKCHERMIGGPQS